jgi:D-beta-D-heptose 7-phosphate kinase/D-beta-D-heptose 1-phosphate adenosyltransferase
VIAQRGEWRRSGKRVIFVSGVFDLLHPGHIRLLEQARELGDILVVAVQSDRSVRRAHGCHEGRLRSSLGRPITPAAERAEILAALAGVDYAVEFDGPTPRSLLSRLSPDVVVKGRDRGSDQSVSREDEKAAGGKILQIPLEPGYSTSRLITRITESHA